MARGEAGAARATSAEYETLAELQAELFATRAAVDRVGGNLNRAVTVLHGTGEPPVWLRSAAAVCARSVAVVDEVISAVHRRAW